MSILFFPTTGRSARPRRTIHAPWSAVMSATSALAREWRIWKASRGLEALSDEMLHDIGISRSEVETSARYGRPFRP